MGKREIKPTVPEIKTESSVENDENIPNATSDSKDNEEEDQTKDETFEKESVSDMENTNVKDTDTSEDKRSTDENTTKDKNKHEEEIIESKQENTAIEVKPQIVEVEEYFVKYRNFSYLHCEWRTEEELYKGDKRIQAKLKRFKQRQQQNTNIFENVVICL